MCVCVRTRAFAAEKCEHLKNPRVGRDTAAREATEGRCCHADTLAHTLAHAYERALQSTVRGPSHANTDAKGIFPHTHTHAASHTRKPLCKTDLNQIGTLLSEKPMQKKPFSSMAFYFLGSLFDRGGDPLHGWLLMPTTSFGKL